jgi:hypothetical protein
LGRAAIRHGRWSGARPRHAAESIETRRRVRGAAAAGPLEGATAAPGDRGATGGSTFSSQSGFEVNLGSLNETPFTFGFGASSESGSLNETPFTFGGNPKK